MSTLSRAIEIAIDAHEGMVDKAGEPYILHPLRVMLSLDTESERIAGVLHDVVEDSGWSLAALRDEGFAEAIVAAVDGVTRREGENYFDFCRRAGRAPISLAVKLADLEDNLDLTRIGNPTPADRRRIGRYRRARRILLDERQLDTAVSPREAIMAEQMGWASSRDLDVDTRGYVASVEDNVLQPLSEAARAGMEGGSGSELSDRTGQPAKLRALHSSAALALNVFDYWVSTSDRSALRRALGLQSEIVGIEFERHFRTGLGGTPPNLDVTLTLADDSVVAIESKFTEWLSQSETKEPFADSYFPPDRKLWSDVGLDACQRLAVAVRDGDEAFSHLDVPQLLKHSLGLARTLGDSFELWYLYFDWPTPVGDTHWHEIATFEKAVDVDVGFTAMAYQDLFERLSDSVGNDDRSFLSYLRSRYFSQPALPLHP